MGCDTDNFYLGYASPHSHGKNPLCKKTSIIRGKIGEEKNRSENIPGSYYTIHA